MNNEMYEIPFTTVTTGSWTVMAASLEEARAIADSGFPYEHATYTDIKDENTRWDSSQTRRLDN